MATNGSSARLAVPSSEPASGQTYRGPFASILFFIWGFMTVFSDILIPRFKLAFGLNYSDPCP